jgi:hypothetical protein
MELGKTAEIKELYEGEKKIIAQIGVVMRTRFASTAALTPKEQVDQRNRYAKELIERCAEAGFVSDVEWVWQSEEKDADGIPLRQSPCVSDNDDDPNLYYIPRLIISGRTDVLKEFDHDRQSHEVREGVFDGIKGVIDPNTGEMREDSKKKDIY